MLVLDELSTPSHMKWASLLVWQLLSLLVCQPETHETDSSLVESELSTRNKMKKREKNNT
jgi:hypothetical protein